MRSMCGADAGCLAINYQSLLFKNGDEDANTPDPGKGAASDLQDLRLLTARTPGPVACHVETVCVL